MDVPEHLDIAISFAGEDRAVAESIATLLASRGISVFYDRFFQSDLWGKDLYEHISDIYTNRAKFCLMLVSTHYLAKKWTAHERKSAQARAFSQGTEYILPLRLDATELPGLPATVGYLSFYDYSLDKIVDLILEKLGFTSESELVQRRNVIEQSYSTLDYYPNEFATKVMKSLGTIGYHPVSPPELKRRHGHVVCCLCEEVWRVDKAYHCVDCRKAYCYKCVWKLNSVQIENTEFRWYCRCRGRVG